MALITNTITNGNLLNSIFGGTSNTITNGNLLNSIFGGTSGAFAQKQFLNLQPASYYYEECPLISDLHLPTKRSSSNFLKELRFEIDEWHGNVLK